MVFRLFSVVGTTPTPAMVVDQMTLRVGIGTENPAYTLHVNGSVAGTSAYTNLSDARLKTNIRPLTGALDTIMRLCGVKYTWDHTARPELNLDTREHVGFLAQDVGRVLPQVVGTGSDGLLSLAYGDLVPVLTEGIKAQQAQITQLRTDNTRLHADVIRLEAEYASLREQLVKLQTMVETQETHRQRVRSNGAAR